jgi:hypothetical protein
MRCTVRAGCSCKRRQLHAFDGGILRVGFFGISSTLIDTHTFPGKLLLAEGWMGGFKEWVDGWMSGWVDGFSSLMKQNKKAKICFVIYIAGKRKLLFYILRCDYMGKNS